MISHGLIALAAIASFALAFNEGNDFVLHEERSILDNLVRKDALDSDFLLPMRVGLTQTNLDKGYDLVMEVSHPKSKKYGQYFTSEEVYDLFAPAKKSVEAVRNWLESSGIDGGNISLSTNKQWLQFDLPTGEAEKLLRTKYFHYEHSVSGQVSVGCDKYYIPEAVQSSIDYITPRVKTLGLRGASPNKAGKNKRRRSETLKSGKGPVTVDVDQVNTTNCHKGRTPECIRGFYDIPLGKTSQPGNELGIFEDGGGYLDTLDLNSFFTMFAPEIPNGTFPIIHAIDGAKNKNNYLQAGDETCGDFDIAYPIVYPQDIVYFLTDDDYYQTSGQYKGFLNTFLDGIDGSYCNYSAYGETGDSPIDPQYPDPHKGGYKGQLQCGVFKPTNVISFSYAYPETGQGIPHYYQQRQCNEYMKLALQGVSLLFASGDEGVGSLGIFNHQGTCPYVTAVGATTLHPSESEEVAWESSGGGFSNVYARPNYQKAAVEAYLKSDAGPSYPYYTGSTYGNGRYNRTGRAYPDVSAIGTQMYIYFEGDPAKYEGTSFSTPLFAGILTRINEERLKAGKPRVGFVNPVLVSVIPASSILPTASCELVYAPFHSLERLTRLQYENPHAFNDITKGSNPRCHSKGFEAGPGWDPITGLGTPNYPALLDVFMKL